jgi:TolA-binding protein
MSILSAQRVIVAVGVVVALVSLHQPAWAQLESREAIALQNQIMELRQQLQTLQQSGRGGGSPTYLGGGYPQPSSGGNDLLAQLVTRVGALEEQVRQLRGRIDETENQVQRQGADLGKRIDDLAFQVNPQGGTPPASALPAPQSGLPLQPGPLVLAPPPSGFGGPPAQPPTALGGPPVLPPGVSAPPAGPVHRTPELAIQEGNAALARRDYPAAEAAAREVLAGNRTSPRAYDAQFLLAQALNGERQYSQAAIAYDDTYNRSKRGVHAPDALLGLANSLTAINERKAACDTLVKLRAEYPTPRPDLHDAIVATAQRAGCK